MFGDGTDYAWALGDDEGEYEDDHRKLDMRYQDVSSSAFNFRTRLTEGLL